MANPVCATNVPEPEFEDTSSFDVHIPICDLQGFQSETGTDDASFGFTIQTTLPSAADGVIQAVQMKAFA